MIGSEKRTFLNRNCYGSRDVLFGCLGVFKGQGNDTEVLRLTAFGEVWPVKDISGISIV